MPVDTHNAVVYLLFAFEQLLLLFKCLAYDRETAVIIGSMTKQLSIGGVQVVRLMEECFKQVYQTPFQHFGTGCLTFTFLAMGRTSTVLHHRTCFSGGGCPACGCPYKDDGKAIPNFHKAVSHP